LNSGEFDRYRNKQFSRMVDDKQPPAENIERLYLLVLSRRPRAEELDRLVTFVQRSKLEARAVYDQVLWVLLNTSEFTLNH
jgi:hypothetical protein